MLVTSAAGDRFEGRQLIRVSGTMSGRWRTLQNEAGRGRELPHPPCSPSETVRIVTLNVP